MSSRKLLDPTTYMGLKNILSVLLIMGFEWWLIIYKFLRFEGVEFSGK
jgi:hypothetical protein